MNILFKFLIFFLTTTPLFSSSLELIKEIDSNRYLFIFDNVPNYNIRFSEDKHNIFIDFNKTDNKFKNNKIISNLSKFGTEIYLQLKNNNLEVIFDNKVKSGLTLLPSIYSNALIVDLFSWEDLNANEEIFRNALIAYESKLVNYSYELLNSISNSEFTEYYELKALIDLQKENIVEAFKNILLAEKSGSKIPDTYLMLHQLLKYRNDLELADKYKNLYLTTINSKSSTQVPELVLALDSNFYNFDYKAFLKIINQKYDEKNARNKKENQAKHLESLFKESDVQDENNANKLVKKTSEQPRFDLLSYIFISILLISILLYSLYFKWKKQVLKNKPSNSNFENSLEEEILKIKTLNHSKKSDILSKTYNNIQKSNKEHDINNIKSKLKPESKLVNNKQIINLNNVQNKKIIALEEFDNKINSYIKNNSIKENIDIQHLKNKINFK